MQGRRLQPRRQPLRPPQTPPPALLVLRPLRAASSKNRKQSAEWSFGRFLYNSAHLPFRTYLAWSFEIVSCFSSSTIHSDSPSLSERLSQLRARSRRSCQGERPSAQPCRSGQVLREPVGECSAETQRRAGPKPEIEHPEAAH